MRLFIFYITIIGISVGCQSARILPSQFQTDISIDGKDREWPTLTKVNYREKYSYGVYNDYEKVYFLFKTFNPRLVDIVSQRGMTVWINGNGSKAKEVGITYLPGAKFRTMEEAQLSEHPAGKILEENRIGVIKGIQRNGMLFELIELTEGGMIASLGRGEGEKYIVYEAQFSFRTIRQYAREKNIDKGKLSLTVEFGPIVISNNITNNNSDVSTGSTSSSGPTNIPRLPHGKMYNVLPMTSNEEIYVKSILVNR